MRLLRFLWSEMSKHFPRSTPKIWNTSRRGLQLDSLMFHCHARGLLAEMATEEDALKRRCAVLLGAHSQVAELVPALWLPDHPCWELAAPTPSLRGLVKLAWWLKHFHRLFFWDAFQLLWIGLLFAHPPACAWSCGAPWPLPITRTAWPGVAWGQQMVTSQISVTSSLTFGNTFVSCYF